MLKKRNTFSAAAIIAIAFTFTMLASSCKKSSSSDDADALVGTYYGTLITSSVYSSPDTITITKSSSSSIVMNSRTGAGSVYTVNGSVSGKNITIASQQVTVPSLSETFTVTGSGNLSGSTLALNMVFVTSGSSTYNLSFSGTKQ
jgi:hypothetical protein